MVGKHKYTPLANLSIVMSKMKSIVEHDDSPGWMSSLEDDPAVEEDCPVLTMEELIANGMDFSAAFHISKAIARVQHRDGTRHVKLADHSDFPPGCRLQRVSPPSGNTAYR